MLRKIIDLCVAASVSDVAFGVARERSFENRYVVIVFARFLIRILDGDVDTVLYKERASMQKSFGPLLDDVLCPWCEASSHQ